MPNDSIDFKPKIDKIIEVMLYITHKIGSVDRYKVLKLIYLAEIAHLNKYWRPITYDTIVAMKKGPVPSTTYDLLKGKKHCELEHELPFEFVKHGNLHYIEKPARQVNKRLLSKSDLEVLDEIIDKYKEASFAELYNLTHQHAGYKNAWASKGDKNSTPIRYEDLLEESDFKADLVDNMKATCRHVF